MRLVLFCLSLALGLGCSSGGTPTPDAAPPALTSVTAERTDLLFRYKMKNDFEQATRIEDIPAEARGAVQVIDLSLSPETRRAVQQVQIFNLSAPDPDGHYAGQFVPREQLERQLVVVRAPQAPIIMYSASWCGVCKKARSFLIAEGIHFVEKDIEKDPAAAKALAEKGRAQGISTSGVPVFDVGGTLISGFDGPTLLRAARKGPEKK